MKSVSFAHQPLPPDVICEVVWLYLRFTLSFRNIEDLDKVRAREGYAGAEMPEQDSRILASRLRDNARAENSHMPIRLRQGKQRFQSQSFSPEIAQPPNAAISNIFNVQRHLISRSTLSYLRAQAMATWVAATASA